MGEIAGMARWIALAAILALGAARGVHAADRVVVGVAMPNVAETRWVEDGASLVRELRARGLEAELRNADNDMATQIAQIEAMVAHGDRALVIAPIADTALADVLGRAAARGVKIIAYDRLIRGTKNVDYLASFDNFAVGVMQAQSLLRGLGGSSGAKFNIELFAGSPNDGNAYRFYDGAMSVLRPLIASGTLVVRSGEAAMRDVATLRWSADAAHARLDNLLAAFYPDRRLDGVLSANDEISSGLIAALRSAGYGAADRRMPIVTGQDCELAAVRAIMAGEQYSSVFKDTRQLAATAAEMAATALAGGVVKVNDVSGYDNGVKTVPAYLLTPAVVYKGNVGEVLVGSGYYSWGQIEGDGKKKGSF